MSREIQIDMTDLKIDGNILDVSVSGNNIIPQIMDYQLVGRENRPIDKDYIKWDCRSIPLDKNVYDCGFAFFSLSTIKGRRNLDRAIKEIKRVLKHSGRLMIWDIEPSIKALTRNLNINVMLPGEKKTSVTYKANFNPLTLKFKSLINLLQKNNYNILKGDKMGDIYYIEAVKIEEDKNENNSGIT